MKIKRSGKIVGGLALAASFALTGVVGVAQQQQPAQGDGQGRAERPWGQEGGKGRRGGGRRDRVGPFGGRMAERLNLTEAQLEQMRQIEERYRATFNAQRERRGGDERRGSDPFAGGAFDESAVRAAARARADAQVEREVAQARMMHEMYNVLTPEQKAQLETVRQQREERGREFRTRRGARQGQQQLQ
ncbi:MAG TPA: Spy/CpxP family protein refolding chaperone [Pyrinomonadaceae bacterium]|jgi:protein CpxP